MTFSWNTAFIQAPKTSPRYNDKHSNFLKLKSDLIFNGPHTWSKQVGGMEEAYALSLAYAYTIMVSLLKIFTDEW